MLEFETIVKTGLQGPYQPKIHELREKWFDRT